MFLSDLLVVFAVTAVVVFPVWTSTNTQCYWLACLGCSCGPLWTVAG